MERNESENSMEVANVEQQEPQAQGKHKNSQNEILESLAVLSQRHRVPAWQLAALCRFMGWEDDRLVADSDFSSGLESLHNRRIGGGRM